MVDDGDWIEDQALRSSRQILRDNALPLFPRLKERLWKDRGPADATAAPRHTSSVATARAGRYSR
jgi:hypothetical protein